MSTLRCPSSRTLNVHPPSVAPTHAGFICLWFAGLVSGGRVAFIVRSVRRSVRDSVGRIRVNDECQRSCQQSCQRKIVSAISVGRDENSVNAKIVSAISVSPIENSVNANIVTAIPVSRLFQLLRWLVLGVCHSKGPVNRFMFAVQRSPPADSVTPLACPRVDQGRDLSETHKG